MSLGSSGNATIRRPRDDSLRCGVYRVENVAVDTSYRAGDCNGSLRHLMSIVRTVTRRFHTILYSAASTVVSLLSQSFCSVSDNLYRFE